MENVINKLVDSLPDLYFDWYARLMPGVLAVLVFVTLGTPCQWTYVSDHKLFMFIIAYVCGHFVQPAAGCVVKALEQWKDKKEGKGYEKHYANYKMKPNPNFNLIAKVSKAHAEANSMSSGAIMLLFVFAYYGLKPLLLIGAVCLLVLFACERVNARYRKIGDLK